MPSDPLAWVNARLTDRDQPTLDELPDRPPDPICAALGARWVYGTLQTWDGPRLLIINASDIPQNVRRLALTWREARTRQLLKELQ